MTLARLTLLAALLLAPPAAAEVVFKRPPPPGSTAPRIDIQIRPAPPPPVEPPPAAALPAPPPLTGPDGGAGGWFWGAVPSALPAQRGRFALAVAAAATPPVGTHRPHLATLQRIAARHGRDILFHTAGTRVSPALALALIAVESAGRPRALSHAGAQGLMQLIPATARRFGVRDAMDPADNIRGGVRYLHWLIEHFDGDAVLALAAYNAGEGAVRRHGGVPPFAETRLYVPKVVDAWSVARLMCTVPPDLPGDPCIFQPTLLRAAGG